jgi:hypothetical protein
MFVSAVDKYILSEITSQKSFIFPFTSVCQSCKKVCVHLNSASHRSFIDIVSIENSTDYLAKYLVEKLKYSI